VGHVILADLHGHHRAGKHVSVPAEVVHKMARLETKYTAINWLCATLQACRYFHCARAMLRPAGLLGRGSSGDARQLSAAHRTPALPSTRSKRQSTLLSNTQPHPSQQLTPRRWIIAVTMMVPVVGSIFWYGCVPVGRPQGDLTDKAAWVFVINPITMTFLCYLLLNLFFLALDHESPWRPFGSYAPILIVNYCAQVWAGVVCEIVAVVAQSEQPAMISANYAWC